MQNTLTAFGSAGAGYKIPGESYSKAQGYIIKCKELAGSLVSSDWICEPFLILQKFKFLIFAPSQRVWRFFILLHQKLVRLSSFFHLLTSQTINC